MKLCHLSGLIGQIGSLGQFGLTDNYIIVCSRPQVMHYVPAHKKFTKIEHSLHVKDNSIKIKCLPP